MKDVLIIGGGPAGISAGVYAARKRLTATLIAHEIGGQSTVSEGVENWIGTVRISGADMATAFRTHLDAYKGNIVEVIEGENVVSLMRVEGGFEATTESGKTAQGMSVLIASGAARRKLTIPSAAQFENKGLTYCASCDGPLFADQDVAVVGGGNAGLETCIQLLAYCKSVTLIHRHDMLKGDAITVEKLSHNPKFKTMCKSEPTEILGDKFVTGMKVQNRDTGEETTLAVEGVFVEIGVMPNTDFAKDIVTLDAIGRIVTDPKNQHTSVEGIWAAGDCTDELYHQNNIAAGDAVKALEDIYQWVKKQ
jgi:alkyl hydroperoxide reductase subunit F